MSSVFNSNTLGYGDDGLIDASWHRRLYAISTTAQLDLFTIRLLTLNDVKSGIFGYHTSFRTLVVIGLIICHVVLQMGFVYSRVVFLLALLAVYTVFYTILVILYLKQVVRVLHHKINNNDISDDI